ncbi:HD domain-containing protein [Candidatus Roizmanbacteria bacterium]|nr:HD domain-containing protein [Candidatus Roizmanbacteria bacterium]
MKTKNRNPALLLQGKKVDPIIEFYFELNHLKQLFRQGWLQRKIPEDKCESVADHLFGSAILTLIIADSYYESLDMCKLLKMVLVHELGEIYIGDATPRDFIHKKVKFEWELKAIIELFSKIPNGKEYVNLWKEYEDGKSKEAQLIKQIDRLEAALQMIIYKLQYKDKNLESSVPKNIHFIPWTEKRLQDKKLLQILREAKELVLEINQK